MLTLRVFRLFIKFRICAPSSTNRAALSEISISSGFLSHSKKIIQTRKPRKEHNVWPRRKGRTFWKLFFFVHRIIPQYPFSSPSRKPTSVFATFVIHRLRHRLLLAPLFLGTLYPWKLFSRVVPDFFFLSLRLKPPDKCIPRELFFLSSSPERINLPWPVRVRRRSRLSPRELLVVVVCRYIMRGVVTNCVLRRTDVPP